MDNNIREALYNLIDELENCDLIKKLEESKKKINEDEELQSLIKIFNKSKEKLDSDLKDAKTNLYSNDVIREYLTYEQELNLIIFKLNKKLNALIDKKGCM